MSVNVTLNGVVYPIPTEGDIRWAPPLTRYLVALGTYSLTPIGGNFTLTGDVNFGATYGLISKYFSSRTALPATAGVLRLANVDTIEFRNFANTGDNILATDASNNLTYNGSVLAVGLNSLADGKIWIGNMSNVPTAQTLTGDVTVSNTGVTTIGALKITDSQVSNSASISYSKLNLSGSILNSDIYTSAGIDYSKLAALTANRVLLSDGSGFISASSITNTSLSYLDATSSIQGQLNSKEPTITRGNLTETTSSVLTITGGTNAVLGTGTTIAVQVATDSLPGYLSASDHNTYSGAVITANAALPSASFTDTAVTSKLLTGYISGAGTVFATDTILQAINKLNGNDALKLPLAGGTMTGDITMDNDKAIVFKETTANGTDSVTLKAPASVTTSYTLQFPPAVASAGQVLTDTAGNGILSWSTPASTGIVNSGTAGQVAYYATSTNAVSTTGAFTVGTNGPNGIIVGTNTNDSASSGYVGEYIEAKSATPGNFTTSVHYSDITSISLTAGDWDVCARVRCDRNGATVTDFDIFIGTVAGDNATGFVNGDNSAMLNGNAIVNNLIYLEVPSYRMSLSSTTTVYLKAESVYTVATPQYSGYRLSARRVR